MEQGRGAGGARDPRGSGAPGERSDEGAGGEQTRRFTDERGVLWTAEVRRARTRGAGPRSGPALVLFSSESRACLASLPEDRPLGELTVEELRDHLRACLSP